MMRRRKWERLRQAALFLLPIAAAAVVLLFAEVLNTMDADRCALGAALQEQAIRRGCTACYAAEGMYPPSLDYLRTRYGVQIDETRYAVGYSVIGEKKLMPDITVTVLENDA